MILASILGGSALGKAIAERGARVLVLERDKQFRDRVRSKYLSPWGVAEVGRLGLTVTLEPGVKPRTRAWVPMDPAYQPERERQVCPLRRRNVFSGTRGAWGATFHSERKSKYFDRLPNRPRTILHVGWMLFPILMKWKVPKAESGSGELAGNSRDFWSKSDSER